MKIVTIYITFLALHLSRRECFFFLICSSYGFFFFLEGWSEKVEKGRDKMVDEMKFWGE